ncbi:ribonuclease P [Candidatus Woesearchaeota archaeon]|nr:ribonuclease P [Candidatus Woesearchaeota archaeon]
MKRLNKNKLKQIALERINILFQEAKSNPSKANRYVEIARKIGMKVNIPIPKEYKRRYCKHCNNYFQSGNYRVRTRNKMVVYYCLNCKKYMKFKINF